MTQGTGPASHRSPGGTAPMEGVRVLDLGSTLPVAAATQVLADLGCDVIKVEPADGGDILRQLPANRIGMSDYHFVFNRSKRSLAVDTDDPAARVILGRLASRSDLAVADATTSVLARVGLGAEDLVAQGRPLTVCRFTPADPTRAGASYDLMLQALSGAMDLTGAPSDPPTRTGAPVDSLLAGLYGAVACLAARAGASSRPPGRIVDISPLETSLALLSNMASAYLMTGTRASRLGTGHISIFPYNSFETSDGNVVVAIFTQNFWSKFCQSIDHPELIDHPHYRSIPDRMAHREELSAILEAIFRSKTTDEWSSKLESADVPYAPVLSVAAALEHPQTQHRDMTPAVPVPGGESIRTVGSPLRFEYSDGSHFRPAPRLAPTLGQHDGELYASILANESV